ncbi:MAG: hypothetical protein K2P23_00395 [Lachnospiraceae bacterium]|nr:hypothetical protein [Lachnospiraceae bacterium]
MVRNKHNTPRIIKYPFWRMVHEWENVEYICINNKEIHVPEEIKDRAICIQGDIGEALFTLKAHKNVNMHIKQE